MKGQPNTHAGCSWIPLLALPWRNGRAKPPESKKDSILKSDRRELPEDVTFVFSAAIRHFCQFVGAVSQPASFRSRTGSAIPGPVSKLFYHQLEKILVILGARPTVDAEPAADHLRDALGILPADLRRNVQPAREKGFNQIYLLQRELGGLRKGELRSARGIEEDRRFAVRAFMHD